MDKFIKYLSLNKKDKNAKKHDNYKNKESFFKDKFLKFYPNVANQQLIIKRIPKQNQKDNIPSISKQKTFNSNKSFSCNYSNKISIKNSLLTTINDTIKEVSLTDNDLNDPIYKMKNFENYQNNIDELKYASIKDIPSINTSVDLLSINFEENITKKKQIRKDSVTHPKSLIQEYLSRKPISKEISFNKRSKVSIKEGNVAFSLSKKSKIKKQFTNTSLINIIKSNKPSRYNSIEVINDSFNGFKISEQNEKKLNKKPISGGPVSVIINKNKKNFNSIKPNDNLKSKIKFDLLISKYKSNLDNSLNKENNTKDINYLKKNIKNPKKKKKNYYYIDSENIINVYKQYQILKDNANFHVENYIFQSSHLRLSNLIKDYNPIDIHSKFNTNDIPSN